MHDDIGDRELEAQFLRDVEEVPPLLVEHLPSLPSEHRATTPTARNVRFSLFALAAFVPLFAGPAITAPDHGQLWEEDKSAYLIPLMLVAVAVPWLRRFRSLFGRVIVTEGALLLRVARLRTTAYAWSDLARIRVTSFHRGGSELREPDPALPFESLEAQLRGIGAGRKGRYPDIRLVAPPGRTVLRLMGTHTWTAAHAICAQAAQHGVTVVIS